MKKLACRYAIVQFLPYVETGEFANVGIVLVCPATGFFGFKLETRKSARFTNFFRDLDKTVYLRSVAAFRDELIRLRNVLAHAGAETVREGFAALVHPREALLRFGDARAILVDDAAVALERLYGHYVEHDFVTPEYREEVLIEQRVQKLIKGLGLAHPFRTERVGDTEFAVRFPLVQITEVGIAKIIKPFFLAQDDTLGIYNHGDQWLAKLRRLQQRKKLPRQVLFTIEGPNRTDVQRYEAFVQVQNDLQEYAAITQVDNETQIVEFAQTG